MVPLPAVAELSYWALSPKKECKKRSGAGMFSFKIKCLQKTIVEVLKKNYN